MALVKAFRTHGHLAARLDPLGSEPPGDPALEPLRLVPPLTPELQARIPAELLRVACEGETLADVLAAPIIKTLTGKMVVPDDSPYTTGGLGLLGTEPSESLIDEIDTLVMLGTNFPYTKYLPPPDKVRVVQVERPGLTAAAEPCAQR